MITHDLEHPTMHSKQQALDPVCGMEANIAAPAASLLHEGTTYLFCSTHCLEKFKTSPGSFTGAGNKKTGHTTTAESGSSLKTNSFTCPMHPKIQQEGPGMWQGPGTFDRDRLELGTSTRENSTPGVE